MTPHAQVMTLGLGECTKRIEKIYPLMNGVTDSLVQNPLWLTCWSNMVESWVKKYEDKMTPETLFVLVTFSVASGPVMANWNQASEQEKKQHIPPTPNNSPVVENRDRQQMKRKTSTSSTRLPEGTMSGILNKASQNTLAVVSAWPTE